MHLRLKIMANNYTNVQSNANGTFHLGDDGRKWKSSGADLNTSEIKSQLKFVQNCPVRHFGDHPYTILNTINCGKWFQYDRFFRNHTIPSFVQSGFEAFFLRSYPKKLHYRSPDGSGFPQITRPAPKSTNTTSKKLVSKLSQVKKNMKLRKNIQPSLSRHISTVKAFEKNWVSRGEVA
mmetsp:Transcript_5391/g.10129  ORF Transcript_5391/g.10129 Transcript_5391/m.10129 type:complete len:178 (-) Transcript_5391:99-632(-)